MARYLNGLKYRIQDEISILASDIVTKCFQLALREEEKLRRKSDQNDRGKGGRNFIGKGVFGGKGQPQKTQGESSQGEKQGGTNFRGNFRGKRSNDKGRFGGLGRGNENFIRRCYSCG